MRSNVRGRQQHERLQLRHDAPGPPGGLADRDQVQHVLAGREREQAGHRRRIEAADRHGGQPERSRLQEDVLRGVTGLTIHQVPGHGAILLLRSRRIGGNDADVKLTIAPGLTVRVLRP